jgi:nucleotide-binding universal stress UspA family protein
MTAAFRIIGCCIDRSPAARAVVEEGVRLRDLGDRVELHLVHAVEPAPVLNAGPFTYVEPPEPARAETRAWLDREREAAPGATGVLLDGDPAEAVCAWAAGAGADLLIATPHHGAIDRAIHGGFAAHLAYHAPCPVLIVPAGPA